MTQKILKRKLPSDKDQLDKKQKKEDDNIFVPAPSKFGQDGGVDKVKEFIDQNEDISISISRPHDTSPNTISIEIKDEALTPALTKPKTKKFKKPKSMHKPSRESEVVDEMKTYHVSLIS